MKPSQKILKAAEERLKNHSPSDRMLQFNHEYIQAILSYLDELYEKTK